MDRIAWDCDGWGDVRVSVACGMCGMLKWHVCGDLTAMEPSARDRRYNEDIRYTILPRPLLEPRPLPTRPFQTAMSLLQIPTALTPGRVHCFFTSDIALLFLADESCKFFCCPFFGNICDPYDHLPESWVYLGMAPTTPRDLQRSGLSAVHMPRTMLRFDCE